MAVIDCILIESGVRVFVAWRCCFYFIFFSFDILSLFLSKHTSVPTFCSTLNSTFNLRQENAPKHSQIIQLKINDELAKNYVLHMYTCSYMCTSQCWWRVHNDLTENGLNLNVVVWFFCADCAGTKVRLKVALSPPHLPESSSSARLLLSGTFYLCHS